MKFLLLLFTAILIYALSGCTPQTAKPAAQSPVMADRTPGAFEGAGSVHKILPREENIRETPAGEILGKMYRGEEVTVKKRVGNWFEFESKFYESGYIWGPSIGYDYVNIYSHNFYLNESGQFRPVSHFTTFFALSGELRGKAKGRYEIFFDEVGLGSHETIVLEVATETTETVQHGISLWVDEASGQIVEARVDFARPIEGLEKALERCDLASQPADETTNARLRWDAGKLLPGIAVTLERKEWESSAFSIVIYSLR